MTNYYYCNDNLSQNIYFKDTQQKPGALFTYMLHGLARATAPISSPPMHRDGRGDCPRVLPKREGVKVDAVEINEAAPWKVNSHLDLSLFDLHIEDGRSFLFRTKHYDAVVRMPSSVIHPRPIHDARAFSSCTDVLNPGGVVVINCFGHLDNRRNFFIALLGAHAGGGV